MKWVLYYLLLQTCFIIFFWIFSKRKDTRYKENNEQLSKEFQPTEEVFIDPVTNVIKRVYVNSKNGERRYIEEKGEN
jgi:flagellar basal body-associated protein FliL